MSEAAYNPKTAIPRMVDPGERKHSPLPWHTGANNPDRVFDANGAPVAYCDPRHKGFPIYENNARLIVGAVNAYGARDLEAILRDRRTDLRAGTEAAWDAIDDENQRLIMLAKTLERERDELQATFDLRWDADMRAIKRWQAATGRDLVWPDHADLCVWLLEQVAELRDKLKEAEEENLHLHQLRWEE